MNPLATFADTGIRCQKPKKNTKSLPLIFIPWIPFANSSFHRIYFVNKARYSSSGKLSEVLMGADDRRMKFWLALLSLVRVSTASSSFFPSLRLHYPMLLCLLP
ncbi:hypothetical protein K443DRAFT_173002 [Laccaria amethystina LaAM-08-1]|uniref:Uncharacterized protein n=1 Tax=Laccaria amethystina LaAM-08-1 TaxID=1095629 RepID=A0A0C9WNX8_9AGAR|nr:hypothetical protein K443DRAFT_173002 [Laccaria amethystina LaAM-08-1]